MRKNFGKPDSKSESKTKVSPKKRDTRTEARKRKVTDK